MKRFWSDRIYNLPLHFLYFSKSGVKFNKLVQYLTLSFMIRCKILSTNLKYNSCWSHFWIFKLSAGLELLLLDPFKRSKFSNSFFFTYCVEYIIRVDAYFHFFYVPYDSKIARINSAETATYQISSDQHSRSTWMSAAKMD